MEHAVAVLADQHAELEAILADLDQRDWEAPSRCDGWTVSDVVLHLAQTDEMALASVQGRFAEYLDSVARRIEPTADVDAGAALMVASERGAPPAEVHARWLDGSTALRSALAECDPGTRVPWVAGELSARTLATTRLAEAWIHTGDVAYAFGAQPAPTERLHDIARLAWRTLPYAFARAGKVMTGPVAFALEGPSGDQWRFEPQEPALTTVKGQAAELCLVAGQRASASETSLEADGPDGPAVLELVRTFA